MQNLFPSTPPLSLHYGPVHGEMCCTPAFHVFVKGTQNLYQEKQNMATQLGQNTAVFERDILDTPQISSSSSNVYLVILRQIIPQKYYLDSNGSSCEVNYLKQQI